MSELDDLIEEAKSVTDEIKQNRQDELPKGDQPQVYTNKYDSKKKGFDAWKDFDKLEPLEIPMDDIVKDNSKEIIILSKGDIDKEYLENVVPLITKLNQYGYTIRLTGDNEDKLARFLVNNIGNKKYYLPYRKYNEDVKAEINYPRKKAYQYALSIWGDKMKEYKPSYRGHIAKMLHLTLGKNLDDLAKFAIIYNADGLTGFVKDTNFDNLSIDLVNFFKVNKILNIPVYNIKNKDSIKDLIKLLDSSNEINYDL